MNKWQETPFETLEDAHATAEKMGLQPAAITQWKEGDHKYFQIKEGRDTVIVAQKADGSGPVRERKQRKPAPIDPSVPKRTFEEEWITRGPWTRSSHATFEEVQKHYKATFVNPENIEVFEVMMYRVDEDEYEYALDVHGVMWSRVLHKPDVLHDKK